MMEEPNENLSYVVKSNMNEDSALMGVVQNVLRCHCVVVVFCMMMYSPLLGSVMLRHTHAAPIMANH